MLPGSGRIRTGHIRGLTQAQAHIPAGPIMILAIMVRGLMSILATIVITHGSARVASRNSIRRHSHRAVRGTAAAELNGRIGAAWSNLNRAERGWNLTMD